jgi:hypothetical protein
MVYNISDLIKEGYQHSLGLMLQQKGSRLEKCVRQELQETQRYYYDQILPTIAQDVDGRHSDTVLTSTATQRRMVSLITSDWADLIDEQDKLKSLSDPTSAYVLNAAYALGRKKDERIIQALIGDAHCGPRGEEIVSFKNENIIPNDYVEKEDMHNGLSLHKLRKARELLDNAEVDETEEQYCLVTPRQISDLLKNIEVTSVDYNNVRALVSGQVDTFMGFKFIKVSPSLLPTNKDGDRINICFSKSAVVFASKGDIKTQISTRPDKRMAVQVYASMSCGATRMDEGRVVQIICKEI